jgi:hypothetical protein
MSPWEVYQQRLELALVISDSKGSVLIRGVAQDDPLESPNHMTQSQVDSLRHALVSGKRLQALMKADLFISKRRPSQEETKELSSWVNSDNDILLEIYELIHVAMRRRCKVDKFDQMFGLTFALYHHNKYWMSTCPTTEMQQVIMSLGRGWYKLLQNSDADLGIEDGFTHAATEALLQDLQLMLEALGAGLCPFPWDKPP